MVVNNLSKVLFGICIILAKDARSISLSRRDIASRILIALSSARTDDSFFSFSFILSLFYNVKTISIFPLYMIAVIFPDIFSGSGTFILYHHPFDVPDLSWRQATRNIEACLDYYIWNYLFHHFLMSPSII